MPAADRRFRRSEQLIAEVPLLPSAVLTGKLLDRAGGAMAIPVTMGERRDDAGTTWVTAQVALNALAQGDYVLELRDDADGAIASAFRIIQ